MPLAPDDSSEMVWHVCRREQSKGVERTERRAAAYEEEIAQVRCNEATFPS